MVETAIMQSVPLLTISKPEERQNDFYMPSTTKLYAPLVGLGIIKFEREASLLSNKQVKDVTDFYSDVVITALGILKEKGYEIGVPPKTKKELLDLCTEILSIVWSKFDYRFQDEILFVDSLFNKGSKKKELDCDTSSFLVADLLNQFKISSKLVEVQTGTAIHALLNVGQPGMQFYLETTSGKKGLEVNTYNSLAALKKNYKNYCGEGIFSDKNFITCAARAIEKLNHNDYTGAIADFNESIRRNPFSNSTYACRADAKFKIKDYSGAVSDYTEAIRLGPSDLKLYTADLYFLRGDAKAAIGDNQGAVADYERAIELTNQVNEKYKNNEPADKILADILAENLAYAHYRFAELLYKMKDYDYAIYEYISSTLGSEKYSSAGYCGWGKSLVQLKDYRGALSWLETSLRYDQNNAEAYYYRGFSKYQLKDIKGAMADYRVAAGLYTKNGNKKYAQKDYQGAIADYDMAIRLDSDNADLYARRGNAKFKLKDYRGATADYIKASDLYASSGNLKYRLKDYKASITEYNKAINFNKKNAQAYLGRANAKYALENYQGAIKDYESAFGFKLGNAQAYFNCGNAYYELAKKGTHDVKNVEKAVADYNEALKLDPKNEWRYRNAMSKAQWLIIGVYK